MCVCSVCSNSLRPHRLQPTRLLCPWDFPGKNIGVGCHFYLQRIFLSRDGTHFSCIARRIFFTAWEAQLQLATTITMFYIRSSDLIHLTLESFFYWCLPFIEQRTGDVFLWVERLWCIHLRSVHLGKRLFQAQVDWLTSAEEIDLLLEIEAKWI